MLGLNRRHLVKGLAAILGVFGVVSLALISAGAAAAFFPARRAARIDPMAALRNE